MRADWKEESEGFRRSESGLPGGWAIGREGAGAEGGEFGASNVQVERARGGAKTAS